MERPLERVRITDLTGMIAGSFASMLLGDLGAEIIKIEPPQGDDGRHLGPPFQKGESHLFLGLNRNKKSVCLDLKRERGKEILRELITRSDIFMESLRPGAADRLGFSYEEVRALEPDIIYCSNFPYGKLGPHRNKAGYELIMQGYASLMHRGERPPERARVSVVDLSTGLMMAYGVLAALYARKETGRGQRVDASLLGSILAMQAPYLVDGEEPCRDRLGHIMSDNPTYRPYRTADSYINIGVLNDNLYRKLCSAIEMPHLADDERFKTPADRHRNSHLLTPIMEEILSRRTTAEWLRVLDERGVPCGPIHTMDDLFKDEQILANRFIVEQEHPISGRIKVLGIPVKFSDTPAAVRSPAPLQGEHTEEVLSWLGYSRTDMEKLEAEGIIKCSHHHRD